MPGIQAADLPARNQVVTILENLDHLRDLERVILQVAIEGRHVATRRLRESEGECVGLAAVELEAEPLQEGVFLREPFEDFPRVVAAAVVDGDDLVGKTRGFHRGDNLFHEFRKVFAFFLDRNDHA